MRLLREHVVAQAHARTVQAALEGLNGDSKSRRGLARGELLDVAQKNHLAVTGVESEKRGRKPLRTTPAREGLVGAWFRGRLVGEGVDRKRRLAMSIDQSVAFAPDDREHPAHDGRRCPLERR